VNSTLLMPRQNEFHLGLDRFQRVENRDGGTPGISEDVFNPQLIECLDECLCSVQLLLAHKNTFAAANWRFSPIRGNPKLLFQATNHDFMAMDPLKIMNSPASWIFCSVVGINFGSGLVVVRVDRAK
jgi:hypothetical protein